MTKASGSIESPSTIAPLIVWLIVQIVALSVPALRIPTSARPSPNPEFSALAVMLVTQICAATLLSPWLFRGWPTSMAVIFTSLPMIFLAAILSATPYNRTLMPGLLSIAWLVALALLRSVMPWRELQQFTTAIVSAWVCLPLLMIGFDQPVHPSISPATSVLALLYGKRFSMWELLPIVAVLTIAITCRVVGKPKATTINE